MNMVPATIRRMANIRSGHGDGAGLKIDMSSWIGGRWTSRYADPGANMREGRLPEKPSAVSRNRGVALRSRGLYGSCNQEVAYDTDDDGYDDRTEYNAKKHFPPRAKRTCLPGAH